MELFKTLFSAKKLGVLRLGLSYTHSYSLGYTIIFKFKYNYLSNRLFLQNVTSLLSKTGLFRFKKSNLHLIFSKFCHKKIVSYSLNLIRCSCVLSKHFFLAACCTFSTCLRCSPHKQICAIRMILKPGSFSRFTSKLNYLALYHY